MSERYQIVDADANPSSKELATFLAKDGQLLLPMLDLVEQAQCAIDDLVDVMGRATIEAILQMSAAGLAGPKQQGKASQREIAYHGTQRGRVALKERQLRVDKPRLRRMISSIRSASRPSCTRAVVGGFRCSWSGCCSPAVAEP